MGRLSGQLGNQGFQFDYRLVRRDPSPRTVEENKAIKSEIRKVISNFRYELHKELQEEDYHRLNQSLAMTPQERLQYWINIVAEAKASPLRKQLRFLKAENITTDKAKQKRIDNIWIRRQDRKALAQCQELIDMMTENFKGYFRNNLQYKEKTPHQKLKFIRDVVFKIQLWKTPEEQAKYLKPEHIKRYDT